MIKVWVIKGCLEWLNNYQFLKGYYMSNYLNNCATTCTLTRWRDSICEKHGDCNQQNQWKLKLRKGKNDRHTNSYKTTETEATLNIIHKLYVL
jgi:hypothetical protein